jgi:hypothetical protein
MGSLRESVQKGAVDGIPIEELKKDDVQCDACHLGKETRKPGAEKH